MTAPASLGDNQDVWSVARWVISHVAGLVGFLKRPGRWASSNSSSFGALYVAHSKIVACTLAYDSDILLQEICSSVLQPEPSPHRGENSVTRSVETVLPLDTDTLRSIMDEPREQMRSQVVGAPLASKIQPSGLSMLETTAAILPFRFSPETASAGQKLCHGEVTDQSQIDDITEKV